MKEKDLKLGEEVVITSGKYKGSFGTATDIYNIYDKIVDTVIGNIHENPELLKGVTK